MGEPQPVYAILAGIANGRNKRTNEICVHLVLLSLQIVRLNRRHYIRWTQKSKPTAIPLRRYEVASALVVVSLREVFE